MNTSYSILSISSSAHLGERINIGLICLDEKQVFFHFSKVKLNAVGALFSNSAKELALAALKGIAQDAREFKTSKDRDLFEQNQQLSAPFSVAYLTYLSRYNNNLIQFSAPENIQVELSEEIFQKLFKKFIFSQEVFDVQPQISADNTLSLEYRSFLKEASPFVNTNFRVTSTLIPELIAPQQVDMIGKNGAYNIAHKIDFNATEKTLKGHLDAFMHLVWVTNEKSDTESKRFIIGNEPDSESSNHDLWENVRQSRLVEYVHFDEKEQILEHFKKTGVKPLV